MVSFIKELGYTGKCDTLSEIYTDHMHQPWRTFATVINRCIYGKSIGLDRLRPSRAQILWGIFYKENVDFVALLWEYFLFQEDNKDISPAQDEPAKKPKRATNPEPAKKYAPTKEDVSSRKPSRKKSTDYFHSYALYLVPEASNLQGFTSLDFLRPLRIFLDQRIASIKGYRGGRDVRGLEDDEEGLYDVLFGAWWCRDLYGAKERDVANFRTKECIEVLV
nr:hypothetical protein [Tanacetum cinerariifolium]